MVFASIKNCDSNAKNVVAHKFANISVTVVVAKSALERTFANTVSDGTFANNAAVRPYANMNVYLATAKSATGRKFVTTANIVIIANVAKGMEFAYMNRCGTTADNVRGVTMVNCHFSVKFVMDDDYVNHPGAKRPETGNIRVIVYAVFRTCSRMSPYLLFTK